MGGPEVRQSRPEFLQRGSLNDKETAETAKGSSEHLIAKGQFADRLASRRKTASGKCHGGREGSRTRTLQPRASLVGNHLPAAMIGLSDYRFGWSERASEKGRPPSLSFSHFCPNRVDKAYRNQPWIHLRCWKAIGRPNKGGFVNPHDN